MFRILVRLIRSAVWIVGAFCCVCPSQTASKSASPSKSKASPVKWGVVLIDPSGRVKAVDLEGASGSGVSRIDSRVFTLSFTSDTLGDSHAVQVFASPPYDPTQKKLLASYKLSPGEHIKTANLAELRAENYELALVPILTPSDSTLRPARSGITSVKILKIRSKKGHGLRYTVKVRNVSKKPVWSLEWSMVGASGLTENTFGSDVPGRPLIKPRGTHDLTVVAGREGRLTAAGFTPDLPESVSIDLAVFADGYEGDQKRARRPYCLLVGQRIGLIRTVALLAEARKSANPDLRSIQQRLEHASDAPTEAEKSEALAYCPVIGQWSEPDTWPDLVTGTATVRNSMRRDIAAFFRDHAKPTPREVKKFVDAGIRRYTEWLSRLQ